VGRGGFGRRHAENVEFLDACGKGGGGKKGIEVCGKGGGREIPRMAKSRQGGRGGKGGGSVAICGRHGGVQHEEVCGSASKKGKKGEIWGARVMGRGKTPLHPRSPA